MRKLRIAGWRREGGCTARALGESIFTEADDLPALQEQVRDAARCHFEEGKQPKIIRLHFESVDRGRSEA